ncbi:hypothetical protein L3X38_024117 [Prunus dulcis]|uniref:Uncharacterized protein n=1 Tax=Prunus dulcis TaxID=3755 RepID=A0AAD4Z669_PRUDU|nr:hypothetical protein L3X38_024117 [Prunus dulcis]
MTFNKKVVLFAPCCKAGYSGEERWFRASLNRLGLGPFGSFGLVAFHWRILSFCIILAVWQGYIGTNFGASSSLLLYSFAVRQGWPGERFLKPLQARSPYHHCPRPCEWVWQGDLEKVALLEV